MELFRFNFLLLYLHCFVSIVFLAHAGRPTEEKLEQRLRDHMEFEIDKDGRPRRQLPTEINIQVTAPLFTARLYDFGKSEGDKEVPPSLDVGIKIDLQRPITFYEQKYNDLYILSNGAIGFDQNSRNYKSNVIRTGAAVIAPLWNRNDLRKGGQIYFREVTDGRIMERAQSEVRYQYDKNIKPSSVLLVTWVNMQPVGEQSVKQDNTNTVQAALITSDNGTYVNFIYKSIGWSQGAEAGFSKGDGQNFYSLPSSGSESIMFLKDYGNTGIPGEWMFEIDGSKVIRCKPGIKGDTCDNECSESEWGNDCENCCHCDKGKCNAVSGECSGGVCKQCWNDPPFCNRKESECKSQVSKECGFNAISFSDTDKCGETVLRCQCLSGYVGDGFNCSDVDECAKKGICHQHAQCFNTPGRFYCECSHGFTGNGTVCSELSANAEQGLLITTQNIPILTTQREVLTEHVESTNSNSDTSENATPKNSPRPSSSHHHRQEMAHVLPKEANSLMNYKLKQPLMIFGKLRNKLTVSSTGVIALDDVSALNADEDLEVLGVRGFAPFFAHVDLSKSPGKVYVAETTQSVILTDATSTVEQHFRARGFLAKTVVTVTYENVTVEGNLKPNTFQVVFIGGNNAAGDNVTYMEYVYADLQWSDDAQAIILTDDPTNTVVLPGSGTDGVKQLAQLSNIRMPGEWMYRVDLDKVVPCPSTDLLPPYCNNEAAAPPSGFVTDTPSEVETAKSPTHRPVIDFEDGNGEPISFPAFITVVPQLVTGNENQPGNKPFPPAPVTSAIIRPNFVTTSPPSIGPSSLKPPQGPKIILAQPKPESRENIKLQTPSVPNVDNSGSNNQQNIGQQSSISGVVTPPLLQIFTTTKRTNRPPVAPTRAQPKIVTAATNNSPTLPQGDDSKKTLPPSSPGLAEDQDGLSSPSKLAIIIPTAIVGVWLLILLIIAIVVCCRRRKSRKRMRSKYDPASSYHFRHVPHSSSNTLSRSKDASTPAANNGSQPTGYPPPAPHANYEDHLEKAARLAEMSPYGGQNGRAAMYGSYWNMPSNSSRQPFSYYNQGYYDSCPEFSRYNYNGRY